MGKKYYEAVFEGKYDVICGMLEGFLAGEGAGWEWYSSKEYDIETVSLTELVKNWAALKLNLHHIILEEEFHTALQRTVNEKSDPLYKKLEYAKSAREIKSCSFKFTATAFAKKFGEEIKGIISAPPEGVVIENYHPVEEIDESAEGVELYAPVHDYTFRCSGTAAGDAGSIIACRRIMDDNPLFKVSRIKLDF